jgi:hypothetical protein
LKPFARGIVKPFELDGEASDDIAGVERRVDLADGRRMAMATLQDQGDRRVLCAFYYAIINDFAAMQPPCRAIDAS